MAKHFTENLINLSSRGLSPNRTPEFPFNHGEGGLDIRPLMVMLQERLTVEVVEVPHPIPEAVELMMVVAHTGGVDLEGDVSCATDSLNRMQVTPVGVGFVGAYLVNRECLGGLLDQSGELSVIRRLKGCGLDTGNYMGFDSADKVSFHPCLLATLFAPLVVKPAGICRSREAGGVNGEVGLDSPQWAGALFNESFQQGGKVGVFKIPECAVIVGNLANQPAFLGLFKLSGESPSRHCCIRPESKPKDHIGQGQSRTSEGLLRLFNTITQVTEQGYKVFLLMGLSLIVGRPFLGACHLDRPSIDGAPVGLGLPLDYKLHGVNVLARLMPFLKVGASAKRLAVVKVYDVSSVTRLGRHFPSQLIFLNLVSRCYYQSSFFSSVHFSNLTSLLHAYITIHCMYLSIPFGAISVIFILNNSQLSIDNSIKFMVLWLIKNDVLCYNPTVRMSEENKNPIQVRLASLQEKGWTLAALADELEQKVNTLEKWKAGDRNPANEKAVLSMLGRLEKRKRIPKKRRYNRGKEKQSE